jgi:UDP-N-acetyl-D-galactosamine dehydrogenase
MGPYVAEQVIKLMTRKRIPAVDANILILGLAFKENCPDLRNTRVIDIVTELKAYHIQADVYDPWVDKHEAKHEYGIEPIDSPKVGHYDAVILAVAHDQFKKLGEAGIRKLAKQNAVIFDVKNILPKQAVDARL